MKVVYCSICNYPMCWGPVSAFGASHWHEPSAAWHSAIAEVDLATVAASFTFAQVKSSLATHLGVAAASIPDQPTSPVPQTTTENPKLME